MRSFDVARTALGNSLRSKLRTFLTVIAIVVGAFTLTLTSGLGAGIKNYVGQIVDGVGDPNQMYVMASQQESDSLAGSGEPVEDDPQDPSRNGAFGMDALTAEDSEAFSATDTGDARTTTV